MIVLYHFSCTSDLFDNLRDGNIPSYAELLYKSEGYIAVDTTYHAEKTVPNPLREAGSYTPPTLLVKGQERAFHSHPYPLSGR